MTIIVSEIRDAIAFLTLSRPETLNALGAAGDGDAFAAVCDALNADKSIRCVVLTGAGRAFSAGGDIKAMKDRSGIFGGSGADIRDSYRANVHRIIRAVYGLEMPVVAAVNGPAIGLGCDLVCMSDIRLASPEARFGVPFLKLGLIPGDGGAWLLPRVIGMSRAAELLYTAEIVNAETAAAYGLVSRVVPAAVLLEEATEMARRIAQQPPHALRLTKSLLRQAQTTSYDTALEMAASTQAIAHLTEDHAEGVAALLEKRPPHFSGR